jgi:hypothetical protein
MRFQLALLFGVIAAYFACRHFLASPAPIEFKTALELRNFISASGFSVYAQGTNPGSIFYISDHALTPDNLAAVVELRHCGLVPSWRGILWVSQCRNPAWTLCPEHIGGTWRIWGNVLVAGDEELMDRLEEMYRIK